MGAKAVTVRGVLFGLFVGLGCGSSQSPANQLGVGADCTMSSQCTQPGQVCLTEFKGGYCGVAGCLHDADCPGGSACVTDNGTNYCFLICSQKTDCNLHRTAADESDCNSSLPFVDGDTNAKVCRPPDSGSVVTDGGPG
jgi:hypothetical protein